MTQQQWTAIDEYLTATLIGSDDALEHALRTAGEAGLPPGNVAPNQGKLLHLFALMTNARQILEIGTLAGYSTIWLARALPTGGRLVTLEVDPRHAEVAATNISYAGLTDRVEIRVGPALDELPRLAAAEAGSFDLIFIDADKRNNPEYLQWSLRLTRPGGVIVVDNVIRDGAVVDAHSDDPSVRGVRRMNELIAAESRVAATAVQTVGAKGHDGLMLAVVTAD